MRDYSYQIYRSLYSCLEVTDTSVEPPTTTIEQSNDQQEPNEIQPENKEEPMISNSGDDVILPGLDLNTEENEKKRKRTPSQVNKHHKKNQFFRNVRDRDQRLNPGLYYGLTSASFKLKFSYIINHFIIVILMSCNRKRKTHNN